MRPYCTQCGSILTAAGEDCQECGLPAGNPGRAPSSRAPSSDKYRWGILPTILGLLALIPVALSVVPLVLLLPLPIATLVSAAALGVLQLGLVWLLAFRCWPVPFPALGLRLPETSWFRTLSATVIAVVCSLGFAQLYTMAVTAVDWEILTPPELPEDLLLPGGLAIFSAVALAMWTPLVEEVFFRGFVMRGKVNRLGFAPGLIVSAAAFSALHFQPAVLVPVFVIGLLLGGLYWYTKSLWPCIALHAAQNLVAVATVAFTN